MNSPSEAFFTREKRRYWDTEFEENSSNFTWLFKRGISIFPYPSCVSGVSYRISYMHNGSLYKRVTRDPLCVRKNWWPPKKTPGFHPPIKDAFAMMADGIPVDVTAKIKRYAGPYGDFHGDEVRDVVTDPLATFLTCEKTQLFVTDMFSDELDWLQITNIMGKTKTLRFGDQFSCKTLWA